MPENAMLACLCSYVVSGPLPRVDFGYLSALQDGEWVSSWGRKMKLVFRTYLTHLPSSFDIEEDVVTNVLEGGSGRYPAGRVGK